ncbi:MAG: hypothetical protein K9W46_08760 [Candidatus Heimdallarchaeum endolithica]|uniref:Uncharacterized protein n=1 Tax=Candidatus Heimdallarchaeum endolithica TaxID=2876572 RepID=A0A9Y1BPE2_9ARCH|nr:MAG: hypothetical protein K9W46_08760 [Candidatus Heimdallarchaeum endolithica]
MSILDWIDKLPPLIEDNGLKLLIYLIIIFAIITAVIVHFSTKGEYRSSGGLTLKELDFDISRPISDIAPEERIEILKIEKEKFIAARKALTDSYKRKKLSDTIFERLSVRYASDLKKIEDEIERTEKEAEVSQLEEELKKMQGDYLAKIAGETKVETTPSTAPTTPPPSAPTAPTPTPVAPSKTVTPPTPTTPTAPTPTPVTPPKTVTPPTPITPTAPTPSTSAPIPAPIKPPASVAQTTPQAPVDTSSGTDDQGDLFAKSTSIAALRKEMLKELDRLKAFMSEQNK